MIAVAVVLAVGGIEMIGRESPSSSVQELEGHSQQYLPYQAERLSFKFRLKVLHLATKDKLGEPEREGLLPCMQPAQV